jgi:hypothetical protein
MWQFEFDDLPEELMLVIAGILKGFGKEITEQVLQEMIEVFNMPCTTSGEFVASMWAIWAKIGSKGIRDKLFKLIFKGMFSGRIVIPEHLLQDNF